MVVLEFGWVFGKYEMGSTFYCRWLLVLVDHLPSNSPLLNVNNYFFAQRYENDAVGVPGPTCACLC